MRLVRIKSAEQQALLMQHRTRDALIGERTPVDQCPPAVSCRQPHRTDPARVCDLATGSKSATTADAGQLSLQRPTAQFACRHRGTQPVAELRQTPFPESVSSCTVRLPDGQRHQCETLEKRRHWLLSICDYHPIRDRGVTDRQRSRFQSQAATPLRGSTLLNSVADCRQFHGSSSVRR